MLSLSALSLSLVCEEDGTEVDSDEFLMTLPDNTMLMALQPGQTWRPQSVRLNKYNPNVICHIDPQAVMSYMPLLYNYHL